jgi:hypothetical protein
MTSQRAPASPAATRPGKVFRGSRRRVRRIRARHNWSIELVIFIVWMVFVLTVVVPWIASHPR